MQMWRLKRKFAPVTRKLESIRRKIIQIISFLILIPIFLFTFYSLEYVTVNNTLLNTLIAASSIIIALIIGFLFNTYFHIKQIRLEKLARFADLQNELRPFQKAFFALTDQLTWKYGHEMFQFPRKLSELQRDEELWKKDEYVPIIWVRAIHDASDYSSHSPDFEISHSILSKERLDEMISQVEQAAGLLGRYKHYQYILKVFHLPDTQDLDQVNIADDSRLLPHFVKGILNENENYHTLDFWEYKLEKWLEILQRLQANGRFVYPHVSSNIKILSLYLLFLAGFGVIIPILLQSIVHIPIQIEKYLENLSMMGFITYFSLSLSRVYKRVTSKELTFD